MPIPPPRGSGFTRTTPVPLYWCTYGPRDAPRLLVLHGGPGADHRYLLPQMLRLADALGIERVENNSEPEDHAATLCEIMASLAAGRFPVEPEAQRAFFKKHIAPWMGRMFGDMERATNAGFYRPVGALGRLFLEIEVEGFTFAN